MRHRILYLYLVLGSMSQFFTQANGGSGGGSVNTLTGNDHVVVGPDLLGNINVVGDGVTLNVTGNAGTNTLTITPLSSPFNPNITFELIDDFFPTSLAIGQLNWTQVGGSTQQTLSTAAHPGLILFGDDSLSGIYLSSNATPYGLIVGGGTLSFNYIISLVGLSTGGNRYTTLVGLGDNTVASTPSNGIYFSYTDNVNGGNWVINCTSASVTTSVNTSVAGSTGFVNLGITVNALATSVSFTINGVAVGSAIATNIPLVNIFPFMTNIRSSGALPGSLLDLFYLIQSLTVAR